MQVMGIDDAQLWGVQKHVLQCARMALIFLHLNPSVKNSMLSQELFERRQQENAYKEVPLFVFLLKCDKSGEDAGHCCLYKEFLSILSGCERCQFGFLSCLRKLKTTCLAENGTPQFFQCSGCFYQRGASNEKRSMKPNTTRGGGTLCPNSQDISLEVLVFSSFKRLNNLSYDSPYHKMQACNFMMV